MNFFDFPPSDSTGDPIYVGDIVRFRGCFYKIKAFGPREGRNNTHTIEFDTKPDSDEIPDELSVDLINCERQKRKKKNN